MADFDDLWDYEHPVETEQKLRALLPDAQKRGDAGYLAELLTQIARTLSIQHKFDEAHAVLDQAEPLITEEVSRAWVRYLLERGRVFNSSRQKEKARPLFIQAWELAQAIDEDFYAVDAAHMVAIVESGETSLEWNLKAMRLASSSTEKRAHGWIGSLSNNIGWTYHDMGQYDRALEVFQQGLEWQKTYGKPEMIHIARWTIGRTLRSLGRIQEALTIQEALLKEDAPDGFVFEEIAELLLALEREYEAKPHFARAYEALSQDEWLVQNESARLERLKAMGGI